MSQCLALKGDETQCTRKALISSDFCWQHQTTKTESHLPKIESHLPKIESHLPKIESHLPKTTYISANLDYRQHLIEGIKSGWIDICQCHYHLLVDPMGQIIYTGRNKAGDRCDNQQLLNLLGYTIDKLGVGSFGYTVKLMSTKTDHLVYAIKVALFQSPNKTDTTDTVNVELYILKKLNDAILLKNLSPHIILYIDSFICDSVPAMMVSDNEQYDPSLHDLDTLVKGQLTVHQKKGQPKQIVDIMKIPALVIIMELAQFNNLHIYLEDNEVSFGNLMIIYFQCIYTLAQIQKHIPGFRHNDLFPRNILVQKDPNPPGSYLYIFDGVQYQIPNIGIQIKITDFGMANIENETNNSILKIFTQFSTKRDDSADLLMFSSSLLETLDYLYDSSLTKYTEFYVNHFSKTDNLTPEKLLKSSYFLESFMMQANFDPLDIYG